MIDALSENGTVSEETRQELLEKTEGNPLFLEEVMMSMAERGEGEATERIPDTLQALIGARIDRLSPESKAVLQRASVIGRGVLGRRDRSISRTGWRASPRRSRICCCETWSSANPFVISDETAYRFKHVLIREVAYSGLSKSARAEYHGRFAEWLAERAGDELLEIRAYHLDHAASLLAELDGAPPEELRIEAAETLHEAGRRALAREANEVAREMFLRAVELEPTLDRRYLAARAAHRLDDFPTVAREMQAVREEAHRVGDRRLEGVPRPRSPT